MAVWQTYWGAFMRPFFVYAHKRPDMQMAYLDQVLWKGGRLVFMLYVVGVIFVSLFVA